MSQSFYLICPGTKTSICVGQGWGEMETLYYGKKDTMKALQDFLNANRNQPIYFKDENYIDEVEPHEPDEWKEYE